jgi:hypothetical protein
VYALGRRSRAALAVAAFGSFAGAYVTTPIAPGTAKPAGPLVQPLATPPPTPTPSTVVIPHRDPFAGEPTPETAPRPVSAEPTTSTGALPRTLLPLPPNAGAPPEAFSLGSPPQPPPPTTPSAPTIPVRVTAVITGAHPYALIDEGETTRLVTLGDRVADDSVAAISSLGIRLSNGRAVPLVPLLTKGR